MLRDVLERSRVVFLAAVLGTSACGGSSQGVAPSGAAAGAGGDGASGGDGANGGTGAAGGAGGAAGGGAASGTGGAAGGAAGETGGGEGGAKAGDGGDGGANAGSAGNAGSSGGGGLVCSEQVGFAQRSPNPILRETTTGTNGTFTDECDANGMLKEYYCEYKTICGPGMTDCAPYPTGKVISRTTACMFLCGGGGCLSPQP